MRMHARAHTHTPYLVEL